MKRKLLITASTFPRCKDDTEPKFAYDLAKSMTKYYDITVLVPATPEAKTHENMEGLEIIRYHYFPIKKWETLCYPGAIVPRIKEKKIRIFLVPFLFFALYFKLKKILPYYDIVHAHWLIPQGIIQQFFSTPYILTGHGGDVTSINKCLFRKLKRNAMKRASYLTSVSSHLKEEMEKIYATDKVEVISMGCDLKKYGSQNRVKNMFQQDDKKVILFVGRMVEKKGLKYLLKAMENIDALLVVVGDGPEKEKLVKLAEVHKEKVLFVGSKTQDELRTIFASCDIFCIPSVKAKDGDQEGLPVVLIEAMASGLPVIGSRCGGISELIEHKYNGILVEQESPKELYESINMLINDENIRKTLSNNALESIKEYDYSVLAKKYYNLFENISNLKEEEQ